MTHLSSIFIIGLVGFELVNVQPVWFDWIDAKWVFVCYCGLEHWMRSSLSFIRSASIAKSWPCYFECLISLGQSIALEPCYMHLWCTFKPYLHVRSLADPLLLLFIFPFPLLFSLFSSFLLATTKCRM